MADKYFRFSFVPDNYSQYNQYSGKNETDEVQMYSDIATLLQIGIRNGYQYHVHSDGYAVMLDFNYENAEMAGATLEWLGLDEYICGPETEEDVE